jgi:hypothetical protein
MVNDIAKTQDELREWLAEQKLLEFVVRAIKGDVIHNQRLTLKSRVYFATKLTSKMLPDLKSAEQKTTVHVDANIRYTATAELISNITSQ